MSLVIRTASSADASSIARVHVDGVRAAFADVLDDDSLSGSVSGRARHWCAWIDRSRGWVSVASLAGEVIGFCALHEIGGSGERYRLAELAALYVAPQQWRGGVGRQLCEHALAEAASRGLERGALWVLESNDRARGFYASIGFRETGESRVFLERRPRPLLELRLERTLARCSEPVES